MNSYTPQTIDTSRIALTPDLAELVEQLAENNHNHWAKKRFAEGWRFGLERNDGQREHPDLAPYGELSECERAYDRQSVVETLKSVIALGYEIKRK
jgi:hypothetical protein